MDTRALPIRDPFATIGWMVRPKTDTVAIDWAALAVAPARASSLVAQQLNQLIREGSLKHGSRLPPERRLAEMLGVSRATVREAVHELWLKGLVARRQGSGTVVTTEDPTRDTLRERLAGRRQDETLTLLRFMDLRSVIEPPIAARAAERATREDLERLTALAPPPASVPPEDDVALDEAFHRAIAETTHNPLLVEITDYCAEWLHATRLRMAAAKSSRVRSHSEHEIVLRAIERGDPADASAAMTHHLRESAALIRKRAGRSTTGG